jgi:hypothetical protein
VLEEMFRDIVQKKVNCEGDNIVVREKKLNEVTDDYRHKYGKELDQTLMRSYLSEGERQSMNIGKIKQEVEMALGSLIMSEGCSNEEALAAELLLTIYSSTLLLDQSYKRRSFVAFQKNKDIEDILKRDKLNFNFVSFMAHKNKIFNMRSAGLL